MSPRKSILIGAGVLLVAAAAAAVLLHPDSPLRIVADTGAQKQPATVTELDPTKPPLDAICTAGYWRIAEPDKFTAALGDTAALSAPVEKDALLCASSADAATQLHPLDEHGQIAWVELEDGSLTFPTPYVLPGTLEDPAAVGLTAR